MESPPIKIDGFVSDLNKVLSKKQQEMAIAPKPKSAFAGLFGGSASKMNLLKRPAGTKSSNTDLLGLLKNKAQSGNFLKRGNNLPNAPKPVSFQMNLIE